MESKKFSLNSIDIKKTLTHLFIYGVCFGAIAALQELGKVEFGQYSQLAGLIIGFLVDTLRKYLQGK